MCTGIVETATVSGSGKGPRGWFNLEQVNVSYDHPNNMSSEHAVTIDFVNYAEGLGSRVAVELTVGSTRKLVEIILSILARSENQARTFPQTE